MVRDHAAPGDAQVLAGGAQLHAGSTREGMEAHLVEHLQRPAQLIARFPSPALTTQPLAVHQMPACSG
jgi:hypothetical protein